MKLQSLSSSLILLIISGLLSGTIKAAEFYDQAEVVRFEAITRLDHTRSVVPDCVVEKPNTNQLMEILHWDLGMSRCIQTATDKIITGYRVFYEWDDQVFNQVTKLIPGQTIPVHIRVD